MNYFRAIVQMNERSERALALTAEAIDMNAANYTAWYYRRLCLEATEADMKKELEFVNEMAEENPKNYQIWCVMLVPMFRFREPVAASFFPCLGFIDAQ
jgi:protein farnesyltransferase/geranylgeranyltransferase type-1 subunit alpha